MRAVRALVVNDLRLYRQDRRALWVGILVPILIAAFFGYIFGGSRQGASGRVAVAVANEDSAPLASAIVNALAADSALEVIRVDRTEAENRVRRGKPHVAIVIPADFSAKAPEALFTARDRPGVVVLVDPSERMSAQVAQGLFAQYAMQEISKAAFSAPGATQLIDQSLSRLDTKDSQTAQRRQDLQLLRDAIGRVGRRVDGGAAPAGAERSQGLTIPYEVAMRPVADPAHRDYNGYAHSFAGMSVQFILFGGIDAGMLLLLLRERGIWQRLRSAPISRTQLLLSRVVSTTLIGMFQFAMIYLAAIAVFGVRIEGSVAGFIALVAAFSLLNAGFGLMLAAIGGSPGPTRGIAALAALLLVMVGGAWVPAFVFPQWLQQASLFSPTRWAVDGLDAVTWRGLGADAAVLPAIVLVGTAVICVLIAVWRFRWEE